MHPGLRSATGRDAERVRDAWLVEFQLRTAIVGAEQAAAASGAGATNSDPASGGRQQARRPSLSYPAHGPRAK
jgi:hypothetical protein